MGLEEFTTALGSPLDNSEMKTYLLFVQLISSLGGFIIAPLYFIYQYEKRGIFEDFNSNNLTATAALIAVVLTISFIMVDSIVIEWNMAIQFPEGFHQWAWEKEELLKVMTEYLTDFDSLGYFLLVFVAIAIVPAIGEELLFRGLIQKYFQQMFGNPHIAIWVTAVLFSAFHMQFFGFFPRMLLGAFFGYLFYFSGNLIYAIIGHFVNNGLTVLMIYLYQSDVVPYDIENTDSIPLETVAIFAIIGVGLFIVYKKQFEKQKKVTL